MDRSYRWLRTLLRVLNWRPSALVILLAVGLAFVGGKIFLTALQLVLQSGQVQ